MDNKKEPATFATGSLGNVCGFNLRTNPLSQRYQLAAVQH
jgi:hypothetical protein